MFQENSGSESWRDLRWPASIWAPAKTRPSASCRSTVRGPEFAPCCFADGRFAHWPPRKLAQSYLNTRRLIIRGRDCRTVGRHPSRLRFLLSENANFAEVCERLSHQFIGPTPECHPASMGRKRKSPCPLPMTEQSGFADSFPGSDA